MKILKRVYNTVVGSAIGLGGMAAWVIASAWRKLRHPKDTTPFGE